MANNNLLTIEDLQNLQLDATSLEKFINDPANEPNPGHPDGTLTTRLGATYNNLQRLEELIAGVSEVSLANGTVGSPSLRAALDTNTGLFFPAADTLAVVTGGSERLRFDASGNVGIGTSSPAGPFHVASSGTYTFGDGTGTSQMVLLGGTAGASVLDFGDSDDNNIGRIEYVHSSDAMTFRTNNTERMRIDSSGNLSVGKTAVENSTAGVRLQGDGFVSAVRNGDGVALFNRLSTDGVLLTFQQDGTTHGSISIAGSTTSYNTSSDARLKTNINDAEQSGDIIDAIQVREFDWIKDDSHQRFGFVAQELEQHFPEAVHTDNSEERFKSVDNSKLVPLLLKEIQDLRKRVGVLEI